jgi:hypothetical protein
MFRSKYRRQEQSSSACTVPAYPHAQEGRSYWYWTGQRWKNLREVDLEEAVEDLQKNAITKLVFRCMFSLFSS